MGDPFVEVFGTMFVGVIALTLAIHFVISLRRLAQTLREENERRGNRVPRSRRPAAPRATPDDQAAAQAQ